MDHNQAMDLITSFFDEEVIEGLNAMVTLAIPDDKDIIFDLAQHENQEVRELAKKVMEALENSSSDSSHSLTESITPPQMPDLESTKSVNSTDSLKVKTIKSPPLSASHIKSPPLNAPLFKSPEVNKKKEAANLSKVDTFIQEMEKPVDLPGVEHSPLTARRVLLPRNRRGNAPGLPKKNASNTTDTIHKTEPENLKNTDTQQSIIKKQIITHPESTDNNPAKKLISTNISNFSQTETPMTFSKHETPLNGILLDAIERGASDIHLFTGYPPILRIHGDIQFENSMPLSSSIIKEAATSILGDIEYRRFVEEMELDMAYHIEGKARFRVNIFNDINGIAMIFRHIPNVVPSMEQLRLPPVFKEICEERKGLILVTGATGSGKTTTIASMIDWINRRRKVHILTIEDPVEFVHTPKLAKITHRQVRQNTKSFTSALRSALRQDPDVILIGEMRDLDSVSIALHAAETGHLVFGTLHTKSAARTVSRLIGIFPSREQEHVRHQLADGLKGVICQHLFKKNDGSGRVPAFEIMRPNSAIANLIRKSHTSQINDAIRSGKSKGMISMVSSVANLINNNRIDVEEALPLLANEEEKDELKSMLNKKYKSGE